MYLFKVAAVLAFLTACQATGSADAGKGSSTGQFFIGLDNETADTMRHFRTALTLAPLESSRASDLRSLRLSVIESLGLPTVFTAREDPDRSGRAQLAALVPAETDADAHVAAACRRTHTVAPDVECRAIAPRLSGWKGYSFDFMLTPAKMARLWSLADAAPLCAAPPPSTLPSDAIVMDGNTKVVEIAGRGRYCATMRDNRAPDDLAPLFGFIEAEEASLEKASEGQ